MNKNFLKVVSFLLIAVMICGFSVVSLAAPGFYPVEDYLGTAPTQSGKVFAGWYTDATCETPYTEKTGSAYAKFVDAGVLVVKGQISAGTTQTSAKSNLRLVTTVDSLNYKNVGFKVTIGTKSTEITSKTVFKKIVAQNSNESFNYKPTDICASSAYFMTAVIANIPQASFATKIDVVPFWTTLDGTRVEGKAKSLSVSDGLKPDAPESDYIKFMKAQYPDYVESPVGLDITFKEDIVGICYPVWHDYTHVYNEGKVYNIAEILAGKGTWGPMHKFHYWTEPALGYYVSSDKSVIRTHMTQLAEAGVDFIVIDNTNVERSWQNIEPNGQATNDQNKTAWYYSIDLPITAILDTCLEMRAEGKETPYIVFWNRNAGTTGEGLGWTLNNIIKNKFVKNAKYKDLMVYMRNEFYGTPKPLLLGTGSGPSGQGSVENEYPGGPKPSRDVRDMTYRTMWGLQEGATDKWSFLSLRNNPRNPVTDPATGKTYYEQIAVSPAAQQTYMTAPTARGRRGGLFFYEQWQNAFRYHPKVVILTVWNEWEAQSFPDINGDGQPEFTDQYTLEYSRDLEPMKGGVGDQYYRWMKQYITAYKAKQPCPRLVEAGR